MQAFGRRHPAVNLIFFIAAAVLTAECLHPLFLAVSLTAALSYAIKTNGKKALKTFFCAFLPLGIFVTLINLLTAHYGVTVLFTLKSGNVLTLESLACGGALACEIIALLLWFMSFNRIMTEEKILCVFGRFFPGVALFIMMVLRFLPMYNRMLKETDDARVGMTAVNGNSRLQRFKLSLNSLSGVITRALEDGIDTADSMKGRGYGASRRKSYSQIRFKAADGIFIVTLTVLIGAVAFLLHSGAGYASYNPIITVGSLDIKTVLALIFYAAFSFSPLIYDTAEVIKWNSLYSTI